MPDPVVHFELPADDTARMSKFYTEVFGWETNQLGPDMGNYILANTTPAGDDGRPKEPGAINGGIFARTSPDQRPSVVLAVEDIRKAMKAIEAAGGKVIGGNGADPGEPDAMPGVGLFAQFVDTEGNTLGLIQPEMP